MKLEAAEADALAAEARAFARALPDPATAARFEQLGAQAATGELAEDVLPTLETMLELVFQRGQPRSRAVLQAIYARTPRGRAAAHAAREVNRALATLEGHTLARVRVTANPAGHSLTLETDRVRLTLELDARGAQVTALETG